MRQFVIKPQPDSTRIHCTMIKHGESFADELASLQPGRPIASSSIAAGSTASSSSNNFQTASSSYTLYMEHLGGFLPLLKGKKVCKIRPEFVIFDPQLTGGSVICVINTININEHYKPNLNNLILCNYFSQIFRG